MKTKKCIIIGLFLLLSSLFVMGGNIIIREGESDATLEVDGTMRIFGEWESKSPDTVYQAASDGFVIINAAGTGYYLFNTDSSNPPTTARAYGKAYSTYGSADSATFPVRKGDYWQVKTEYMNSPDAVWWISLGI